MGHLEITKLMIPFVKMQQMAVSGWKSQIVLLRHKKCLESGSVFVCDAGYFTRER